MGQDQLLSRSLREDDFAIAGVLRHADSMVSARMAGWREGDPTIAQPSLCVVNSKDSQ